MADDFARIVAVANPATQQYQMANTGHGYPPSSTNNSGSYLNDDGPLHHQHNRSLTVMDLIFDMEDDMPDSAFGQPIPMQSKESRLPLQDCCKHHWTFECVV